MVPPKGMTKFTEDSLLRYAQFICDQVSSFDDSAKPEDDLLIITPCMRSLAKLAGVTLGKRSAIRQTRRIAKAKTPAWTMATTTKLVSNMFENLFTDQLAKHDDKVPMVRVRYPLYLRLLINNYYIMSKFFVFSLFRVLNDSVVVFARIVNNLIAALAVFVKI